MFASPAEPNPTLKQPNFSGREQQDRMEQEKETKGSSNVHHVFTIHLVILLLGILSNSSFVHVP